MTEFNKKGSLDKIKGRGQPLGGAPPVKIPPLNADPIPGPDGEPLTMSQQAEILNDPRHPMSPHYNPTLADASTRVEAETSMDPHKARAARGGQMPPQRPKGPFGGTVPPEAAADPNFRPGVGSMYAANQPGLQKTRPDGKPQLSAETVEGLDALHKFNAEAQAVQEKQAEEAKQKELEKGSQDRFAEDLGLDDEFVQEMRRHRAELDTEELRKAIESRVNPMSIDQLIEEGELRQEVDIVRGKFVVVFRTLSGEEDLSIKRELYTERSAPDIYLFDKMSTMQLAAALYAINGRPLPDHLNDKRRFDKDLFAIKFKQVNALPLPMLASLAINFSWFDQRARKLFVDLDELKNG
jgi:hypothetical protein